MDEDLVFEKIETLGLAMFWLESHRAAVAIAIRRMEHTRRDSEVRSSPVLLADELVPVPRGMDTHRWRRLPDLARPA